MSLRHATATEWADDLSAAAEPRLGILEAYALQRHPEVLAHMGEDGAGLARVAAAKGNGLAGLWLFLPALLAVISPLIGIAAILGDPLGFHRMDASASVPIAGVSFAIAAIVQVGIAAMWLRGSRPRDGWLLLIGFGTAALAAATWWVMGTASSFDGFDGAALWRVPVVIAGLLGAALGALMLVLGRSRDVTAQAPVAAVDHQAELRSALATIPADELRAMREDRDDAIELLRDRGRLPSEVVERALRAELGTLHRIDAERRGTAGVREP